MKFNEEHNSLDPTSNSFLSRENILLDK